MLNSIEDKLAAIKAINQQKDTIDTLLQHLGIDANQFTITIAGQQVKDLISAETYTQLRQEVTAALAGKRQQLIDNAKQLMK